MSAGGMGGMSAVAGAPAAGMGGMSAAGAGGTAGMSMANGETGRLVGMTAAHNAVRASVQTTPPLAPLTWSPTIAAYAQQWADQLAMTQCSKPMHRSSADLRSKGYGENLAAMAGKPAPMSKAQDAVNGWGGEVACYTFGTLAGTEKCDTQCYMQMHSDGCGHYTAIVWRKTTEVGCGVASCEANGLTWDIWICNYAPAGNIVGQTPY